MVSVCDSSTSDRLWLRSRYDNHTCHTHYNGAILAILAIHAITEPYLPYLPYALYQSHTHYASCTSHTTNTSQDIQAILYHRSNTSHNSSSSQRQRQSQSSREEGIKCWQTVARWTQGFLVRTNFKKTNTLDPPDKAFLLWTSRLYLYLYAYLIFVFFSPQAQFLVQFFSTQKSVNRNKTDFATKQRKL